MTNPSSPAWLAESESVPSSGDCGASLASKQPLSPLAADLWLERREDDLFVGRCHQGAARRTFGGHLASQSLMAASRTTDLGAHSMHGYFLAPGLPGEEISYRVERMRDGRSYANRRVVASQDGQDIFALAASFKTPGRGFERATTMPEVPGPDDLPDPYPLWRQREPEIHAACQWARVVDLRWVDGSFDTDVPGLHTQMSWARIGASLGEEPRLHPAALTYFSDLTLAFTSSQGIVPQSTLRTGPPPPVAIASLDHSVWFHRPFRADEWLLFVQTSQTSGDGRGLSTGDFFDRSGSLVASATQECLLRPGTPGFPVPEVRVG